MRYLYEAILMPEEEGYSVSFPQFPFALTFGDTFEEAALRAAECLELEIAAILSDGKTLPEFVSQHNPSIFVSVEVTDEMIERSKYITIGEAAKELGVSNSRVSQLLKTGALESIEMHGKRLVSIRSVVERKANPPAAHRPKMAVAG